MEGECGRETGGADVAAAVHVGWRQPPRTTTTTTAWLQLQQLHAVLDAVNDAVDDAAERVLDAAYPFHQLLRFNPIQIIIQLIICK